MPVIKNSDYETNFIFKNNHINTIYTSLFRKIDVEFNRETIATKDGDFLDLDCLKKDSKSVAIICHGLEGSSNSQYVKGVAKHLFDNDIDVFAMNYRSCSGRMNKQLRLYHSGATNDLDEVVEFIEKKHDYESIILIGYSLGGNLVLKYAGEKSSEISKKIKTVIAFSAPCHLRDSQKKIDKSVINKIYLKNFLISLNRKIKLKRVDFPDEIVDKKEEVKSFFEFDDIYTAPIHGFEGAKDYYRKSSAYFLLDKIAIPTLLVNSKDDPMLVKRCYPIEKAKKSESFYLEIPKFGGHIGFNSFDKILWSEKRVLQWIKQQNVI